MGAYCKEVEGCGEKRCCLRERPAMRGFVFLRRLASSGGLHSKHYLETLEESVAFEVVEVCFEEAVDDTCPLRSASWRKGGLAKNGSLTAGATWRAFFGSRATQCLVLWKLPFEDCFLAKRRLPLDFHRLMPFDYS